MMPGHMTSSLLAKKARLVLEVAGRLTEHLDPAYREPLIRCLNRLDILSLRYLGSQSYEMRLAPQEVALVSEASRPFGWAVWLAILTDAKLDDPEWILGGILKGSDGWGFTSKEGRQWRTEYVRAHLAPAPAARRPAPAGQDLPRLPPGPRLSDSPARER